MNAAFNTRMNPRLAKRERLTVSSAAVGFAFTANMMTNFVIPPSTDGKLGSRKSEGAVLQISGADSIYYTLDGSTPSSTVGFKADPGDYIYLNSFQQVRNFLAIRVTTDTSIEALAMFPV